MLSSEGNENGKKKKQQHKVSLAKHNFASAAHFV